MKTFHFFTLGCFLLLFVSCNSEEETNTENALSESRDEIVISKKQFDSAGFTLGELKQLSFENSIHASGQMVVLPKNQASVSSLFPGLVSSLNISIGDRVVSGQTLFLLENPEYVQLQQSYLEAKAELSVAKSEYERQKTLQADQVSSQKNLIKAESDFQVLNVKIQALRKKVAMMGINPNELTPNNIQSVISVKSPINGYITEIRVFRGSFLNPGEIAVSIVNADDLEFRLNIFEKDISKVQAEQKVTFNLPNNRGEKILGKISRVSKAFSSDKKSFEVFGSPMALASSTKLFPGMYIEADLIIDSVLQWALPEEAVVDLGNTSYVLVLEKKSEGAYVFSKKMVEVGTRSNGFIAILNTEKLGNDSKFLIDGAFSLIQD